MIPDVTGDPHGVCEKSPHDATFRPLCSAAAESAGRCARPFRFSWRRAQFTRHATARTCDATGAFASFRSEALGLLERRWHVITIATLAGHLTVFVLLLVCLRVTGVTESEITVVEAFAAWALVRILGALPLTPGGVGFVEVGLTGALVAFGASNAEAVAATLLYRALTVLPTLALGLLAAATWRTHHPGDGIGSSSDP